MTQKPFGIIIPGQPATKRVQALIGGLAAGKNMNRKPKAIEGVS